MRRFLVVATAATLAYCLVDAVAHNGGEAAGHTGAPTFSAEITSVPADGVFGFGRADDAAASPNQATVTSTDDLNSSAEKPAGRPATITAPPKVRAAAATPRAASRHAAKSDTVAPTPLAAPAHLTPAWAPPMQPIVVAQRSSVASGCSGAKWSQPDAAGVPVLVCN